MRDCIEEAQPHNSEKNNSLGVFGPSHFFFPLLLPRLRNEEDSLMSVFSPYVTNHGKNKGTKEREKLCQENGKRKTILRLRATADGKHEKTD